MCWISKFPLPFADGLMRLAVKAHSVEYLITVVIDASPCLHSGFLSDQPP